MFAIHRHSRGRSIFLVVTTLVWAWLAACAAAAPPEEGKPGEEQAGTIDPWAPLRLLEGSWEGSIDGVLGQGTGRRSYEFVLDDKFVLMRHTSVRLPQEQSPSGDHHRELAVYSFDQERKTIVLREFIVEGYVLRYTCEVKPKRFVCTSDSIENGPGMRARLTIEITDRYRFDEIFELASAGQELKLYFTNRWTRVPALGH